MACHWALHNKLKRTDNASFPIPTSCSLQKSILISCKLCVTQGHCWLLPWRESMCLAFLSASKVWWLELSQLPLCSEFDKENSMEFSLNSLLLIHFTTVAMRLLSHGPHVTLVMWHTVTVTCDMTICDHPSHHCDIVTKSHDTFCTPSCSCKSNEKRKEKKRKEI